MREWTEQEINILVKMAERGLSIPEIQKVLVSRSRDAITGKASNLKISLDGFKPEINLDAYNEIMGTTEAVDL